MGILSALLFCFIIFHPVIATNGQYKEFVCLYTQHPVVVDGNLDEWHNAFFVDIEDEVGETDNTVLIYAMWDAQNLYFAFDVRDKDLQARQTAQDHSELYLDDMVEFLLDPLNDKDSCWAQDDIIYHINILGQKKDDRGTANCLTNAQWDGDAKFAVKTNGSVNEPADIDTGYIVEVSISWGEIRIKPLAGRSIGVNFGNGDDGRLFDWVNAKPFRSPYAFGNLVLSE